MERLFARSYVFGVIEGSGYIACCPLLAVSGAQSLRVSRYDYRWVEASHVMIPDARFHEEEQSPLG